MFVFDTCAVFPQHRHVGTVGYGSIVCRRIHTNQRLNQQHVRNASNNELQREITQATRCRTGFDLLSKLLGIAGEDW